MIDLAELERLAAAATPGPWLAEETIDHDVWLILTQAPPAASLVVAETGFNDPVANAHYLAACDPATVAALVQAVRAADLFSGHCAAEGFTDFGSGQEQIEASYVALRAALAAFQEPA